MCSIPPCRITAPGLMKLCDECTSSVLTTGVGAVEGEGRRLGGDGVAAADSVALRSPSCCRLLPEQAVATRATASEGHGEAGVLGSSRHREPRAECYGFVPLVPRRRATSSCPMPAGALWTSGGHHPGPIGPCSVVPSGQGLTGSNRLPVPAVISGVIGEWVPLGERGVEDLGADLRGSAERRAAAFSTLLDRCLDRSFRLAAVILGDRDDAEDAVSDAALRAWQHLSALRDTGALRRLVHPHRGQRLP